MKIRLVRGAVERLRDIEEAALKREEEKRKIVMRETWYGDSLMPKAKRLYLLLPEEWIRNVQGRFG